MSRVVLEFCWLQKFCAIFRLFLFNTICRQFRVWLVFMFFNNLTNDITEFNMKAQGFCLVSKKHGITKFEDYKIDCKRRLR